MIKSFLNRFKNSRPFKDFHRDWIITLKSTHLPFLTRCLLSQSPDPHLLSIQVQLLYNHFNTYFTALDLASNHDVSQLLFPDFRNHLETPFLWLGDFHPYIFTNLLRSFLDDDDSDESDGGHQFQSFGNRLNVWKTRDSSLGHFVEQVECGLRLMVPAIVKRVRDAQMGLVDKLGVGWKNKGENFEVGEIVDGFTEEITCIFLDANRLRRSVVSDIMRMLTVHQAALFLQGLAQFYVGFSDNKLLAQFNCSNLVLD